MDVWVVNKSLGFDFGDFNDWTDLAARPGSPGRRYFEAYAASAQAAQEAHKDFWTWGMVHAGEPGSGLELQRRGLEVQTLERQAVKALEDLLRAYREDAERGGL